MKLFSLARNPLGFGDVCFISDFSGKSNGYFHCTRHIGAKNERHVWSKECYILCACFLNGRNMENPVLQFYVPLYFQQQYFIFMTLEHEFTSP